MFKIKRNGLIYKILLHCGAIDIHYSPDKINMCIAICKVVYSLIVYIIMAYIVLSVLYFIYMTSKYGFIMLTVGDPMENPIFGGFFLSFTWILGLAVSVAGFISLMVLSPDIFSYFSKKCKLSVDIVD